MLENVFMELESFRMHPWNLNAWEYVHEQYKYSEQMNIYNIQTDVYFPWNTLPLIVTFYDTWPSDLDQLIVYLFLFYTIVIFR